MSAPIDPTEVLTLLSQERMAWYKKDPNSWRLLSDAEALRRYEDQAALQAKTWVFIGGVEVILRNALHRALTDHYGAWHDEGSPFARVLAPPDAKRLREARHTCETDRARRSRTSGNVTIEPGHVVAALTFGFWRKLLSRSYDRTLWVPTSHCHLSVQQSRTPRLALCAYYRENNNYRCSHDKSKGKLRWPIHE